MAVSVRWMTVVLDRPAPTFDQACRFWTAVTLSEPSPDPTQGDLVLLQPADGDAFMAVKPTLDDVGTTRLCLAVDEVESAARSAVDLGARAVGPDRPGDLASLRSPTGLAFTLARHRGASTRPRPPVPTDPATRTLVDQVCIDIAPDDHEREHAFWAALTGWEQGAAGLDEFSYLVCPDHVPLRLLLQRLDEVEPGRATGGHIDLACDDRDAAAALHQELGAERGERFEHWTVMTDPSGQPYCLTRRHPDTGLISPSP